MKLSMPLMTALMLTFLAPAGFAQSSFDEGSFNDTPSRTQPSGAGTVGGFDDGSFEPGGSTGPGVVAPVTNPPASQPGAAGSTGFPGGGSAVVGGETRPGNGAGTGGSAPQPAPAGQIDPQIIAFETRDFGVPAQNALRQGQFHAPTPTALPGGYLVTTNHLVDAMNAGTQMVVIDVLGSGYGLPGALNAPALASGGSFRDRTQQQATIWLQQITRNNRAMPIVIYCSDPMCWLSFNASLRAIAAGYSNVYWYRGGIKAWQMAGLQMRPSGF